MLFVACFVCFLFVWGWGELACFRVVLLDWFDCVCDYEKTGRPPALKKKKKKMRACAVPLKLHHWHVRCMGPARISFSTLLVTRSVLLLVTRSVLLLVTRSVAQCVAASDAQCVAAGDAQCVAAGDAQCCSVCCC